MLTVKPNILPEVNSNLGLIFHMEDTFSVGDTWEFLDGITIDVVGYEYLESFIDMNNVQICETGIDFPKIEIEQSNSNRQMDTFDNKSGLLDSFAEISKDFSISKIEKQIEFLFLNPEYFPDEIVAWFDRKIQSGTCDKSGILLFRNKK